MTSPQLHEQAPTKVQIIPDSYHKTLQWRILELKNQDGKTFGIPITRLTIQAISHWLSYTELLSNSDCYVPTKQARHVENHQSEGII